MTILMILWLPGDPWAFHQCPSDGQMVWCSLLFDLWPCPVPAFLYGFWKGLPTCGSTPRVGVTRECDKLLVSGDSERVSQAPLQGASADRATMLLFVFSLPSLSGTNRRIQSVEEGAAI